MQPRQAAFRLLRRIAIADLAPATARSAQPCPSFTRMRQRALHIRASPILLDAPKVAAQETVPFEVPKPSTALPSKAITKPTYELTFTCKPCSVRSTHEVSKQGYHHGSVLISCPGCKNRHVITDHLKIFGETPMSLDDLIKEKGQLIKKGTLSEDGNFEVWADGSETPRADKGTAAWQEAEQKILKRMMGEDKSE